MTNLISSFVVIISYLFIYLLMANTINQKTTIVVKTHRISNTMFWIVGYSIIWGLYSYYIIGFKDASYLGGDRGNYYADFTWRVNEYFLFNKYLSFFKSFTDNFPFVVAITTTFGCLLAFYALRKTIYFNKQILLAFFLQYYIFSSLTNMKQIFVDGIAAVFFVLIIENRQKTPLWVFILLIICACGFHSTAFILIFMFFLLRMDFNKTKIATFIIAVFFACIFLRPMLGLLEWLSSFVVPQLATKIHKYNTESSANSNVSGSGILLILKGVSYYILAIFGVIYREKGVKKYEHYDKYLLLTIIASMMMFIAVISYWYSRFTAVFYVPVAIFFTMMINSIDNNRTKNVVKYSVLAGWAFFTFRSVILTYVNFGGY